MDSGATRPSQMMVRTVILYSLIHSLETLYMFINKGTIVLCGPNITQPKLNC